MTSAAVDEILKKIDDLSEAERLALEQQLAERAEAQWLRESIQASALARQHGLDQAAIDRAVEQVRYGARRGAP
jgi:hypothetical protein